MSSNHVISSTNNRLRFVFNDAVISLNLPASATFEDIAQAWSEVTSKHCSHLVCLDVKLTRAPATREAMHAPLIIAS